MLLSGLPGTGKTLLARAVAGEANAPFYSMAASEFVEAIVGVGAARVRDLFREAKENAPAIVFIDELDAVGRARTTGIGGFSGGNDEREQTLNQILTEMDGFDSATNVIVIGATNRPDVLDPALLRPGRFDRRVAVQPPDRAGREAILRVHTRGVPLGPDVDLARIAATTPGMVGADLANLVNEAALTAARRGHDVVEEGDFTDALERIVLGAERQVMISDEDRRRTAYHEGGHAIVGMLTPGADPVRKVSIIPRGMALGVTFSAPDADRFNYLEPEILARIKVALGGRVAEEIVFGEISTGAESDIEQLTRLARQMVGRWGMSDAARAGLRDLPRRVGAVPPRRPGGGTGDPKACRRRGAPHRRRGTSRGRHPPDGESAAARLARERTARARDAGRGRRLRSRRRHPTPGDPGRRACRCRPLQDVTGARECGRDRSSDARGVAGQRKTPIVGAPLAGGPSTPALAAAVSEAGGLGFVAAGYKTAAAVEAELDELRMLTSRPVGINLFYPVREQVDAPAVDAYAERMRREGERYGVAAAEPRWTDDDWAAKLELVAAAGPDVVSFTFGCPDREIVEWLRAAGRRIWCTVTSVAEAEQATGAAVDVLVVQGAEAGGHQGSFHDHDDPPRPLIELLQSIRRKTGLPLIAAGGIATAGDIARALASGAAAAQIGSALLLSAEAANVTASPRSSACPWRDAAHPRLHGSARPRHREPLRARTRRLRATRLSRDPQHDGSDPRGRPRTRRRGRHQPLGRNRLPARAGGVRVGARRAVDTRPSRARQSLIATPAEFGKIVARPTGGPGRNHGVLIRQAVGF